MGVAKRSCKAHAKGVMIMIAFSSFISLHRDEWLESVLLDDCILGFRNACGRLG